MVHFLASLAHDVEQVSRVLRTKQVAQHLKIVQQLAVEPYGTQNQQDLVNRLKTGQDAVIFHEQVISGCMAKLAESMHCLETILATSPPPSAPSNAPVLKEMSFDSPSKDVLMYWVSDNLMHPFPTYEQKQALAKSTGLTIKQVSDWFCNFRKRKWAHMVCDFMC